MALEIPRSPWFAKTTGDRSYDSAVAYQHAGYAFLFKVVDGDGNAIDLSGKDIQFVVADPNGTLEYVLSGASVSIGGASNNQVTVTATDTRTQTAGVYQYFLRNQTDDEMLAVGSLEVVPTTDIP